jgi:hypothetical protein
MFRRRLTLVLLLLAAAVVLQGVAAVFAVREAERQVVRGRVASDILQRFVDLSATKQRTAQLGDAAPDRCRWRPGRARCAGAAHEPPD